MALARKAHAICAGGSKLGGTVWPYHAVAPTPPDDKPPMHHHGQPEPSHDAQGSPQNRGLRVRQIMSISRLGHSRELLQIYTEPLTLYVVLSCRGQGANLLCTGSRGVRPNFVVRHSRSPPEDGTSTDALASRHATCCIVARPYALKGWASILPFPGRATSCRCDTSLLPTLAEAPDRTSTNGGDELTNAKIHHGITSP